MSHVYVTATGAILGAIVGFLTSRILRRGRPALAVALVFAWLLLWALFLVRISEARR